MNSFEYPATCPSIDKVMNRLFDIIKDVTTDNEMESVYNPIVELFEDIRSINVEMRNEAERQLDELHSEISELKRRLADYE